MDEALKGLLQLSSELAYVQDIRTSISKLATATRTMLGVEICSIFLHDEATQELWSFEKQEAEKEIRFPDSTGIAGYVFQAKESLIILDAYGDSRFNPEVDKITGFKTEGLIALPLVNRKGKTIGVVEAINKLNGNQFTNDDLDLLNHLGLYMSAFLENNMLYEKLRKTQEAIIQKLSRASRFKDEETFYHTVRVAHYALLISQATDLTQEAQEMLYLATPLHDIGKVGIPDVILRKPGKLTEEEFAIVKTHTTIGAEILAGGESELTDLAARISLEHHERWDGNGYPRQKAGEEISLEARITSVADTYDVLCSKRPYKEAYPPEQAMEELIRCRGTQFDPDLVDAFLRNEKEVRSINLRFAEDPTTERPASLL